MTPSARAETNFVRMPGVFAVSNRVSDEQLQLPIEAPGIAVLVTASGQLRLSPDFDIAVWLGERWLATEPLDPDGWVRFTWYELVKALYGDGEGSGGHRTVRASVMRLMSTLFTVDGYDSVSKSPNVRLASTSAVITELVEAKKVIRTADLITVEGGQARLTPDAARYFGSLRGKTVAVRMASWMCAQLAHNGYTYLDFATLRRLDGVAKRCWVYLQAEKYTPQGDERRVAVIGLGRPALNGLGVGNYAQHRQARAALKRAGVAICEADPRFEHVGVHQLARGSHQLRAVRLSPQAATARARELKTEAQLAEREAAQERARHALANSPFAAHADTPPALRAWPAGAHPDELAAQDVTLAEREQVLLAMLDGPHADHARRRLAQLYAELD